MDARTTYESGRETNKRTLAALEARVQAIATARLVCVLVTVGLFGGVVWGKLGELAWIGIAALVVAFIVLVVVHARLHTRKDEATAVLRFHERGIDRLDGRWNEFAETGAHYAREDHPYADDLDIFGRASLFQLVCATETAAGADHLARLLGGADRAEPLSRTSARQDAVRELASRVAFREQLSAAGAALGDRKPDPAPFVAWAEQDPSLSVGGLFTWGPRLLPIVTIGTYAVAPLVGLSRGAALIPLAVQLLLLMGMKARIVPTIAAASSRHRGLAAYAEMFARIESEPFESPLLKEMQRQMAASGTSATREMKRIARIVDFLDARENEVFRIFISPLLMWDLNWAIPLDTWRARVGRNVRGWLSILGEIEALSSLAGFTFDRPDHAFPKFVGEPVFVATELGHPLLSKTKRVANDVTLSGPGTALVVTGSNMSGKSTLLRAMGVNAVLARAGAPVCCASLTIGRLDVATSMRVRDSLEEGVSRFYAELKKLKNVIAAARTGDVPCLFLLDEILHGTNSRERVIGARAIVCELVKLGALGAVSTHDVVLGELEAEMAGKIRNVHFEEQVSGEVMTFDYRLREGVVQSSNALRLMKIVGLDVLP